MERSPPTLAPSFKPIAKMSTEELRTALSDKSLPISGSKAVLAERLRMATGALAVETSEITSPKKVDLAPPTSSQSTNDKPTELMLLFSMMKQQSEESNRRFQAQQEAAEERFRLQLEVIREHAKEDRAQQEAAEERFRLQLEVIREHAKEERHQLQEFLADSRKNTTQRQPTHWEDSNAPDVVVKRFDRMHQEVMESLTALELKRTDSESAEEIEVYLKTAEIAMQDLKSFVDSKIDLFDDCDQKTRILDNFRKLSRLYLSNIPLAKSALSKLKIAEELDKKAGSLPIGVVAPSFNGDILAFPAFWECFEPLVHDNPKVSKFYKITYLKAAMKGTASGVLDGFSSTADNYQSAVGMILKRYGRSQAIIRSHVKDMLEGKRAEAKVESIRNLYNRANAKRTILSKHNVGWDNIFTQVLESQLPSNLYERWMRKISPLIEKDQAADSELLLSFILTELSTMESLSKHTVSKPVEKSKTTTSLDKDHPQMQFSAQSLVAQSSTTSSSSCFQCGKKHSLKNCDSFLRLTATQRLSQLMSKPGAVCFRCLSPKGELGHPHSFYSCKARCTVENCGKPHHRLLHVEDVVTATNTLISSCEASKQAPSTSLVGQNVVTILPTALAQIEHLGATRCVRIALDSLSQETFITREVASELGLPVIGNELLNVTGFGGVRSSERMDIVRFKLCPLTSASSESIEIQAHVKDGIICTPIGDNGLNPDQIPHLRDLQLADPLPRRGSHVDILLGARYYFALMQGPTIGPSAPEGGPYAIHTVFGWVVAGPAPKCVPSPAESSSSCLLIGPASIPDSSSSYPWRLLDEKLERFWKQDSVGICDKETLTSEEANAIEQFERSVSFDESMYRVSLPFASDAPELQPNYKLAYSRLLATERALRKQPGKLADYDAAIMQYEIDGFSRKLTDAEFEDIKDGPHYFVPHHPVFKDSCSTKLRIVFDASARNSEGVSLNDCLQTGPNLLPDIVAVLLRFRTHKIAMTGDIRKMFCQTKITPDHQRYQLYLWRNGNSTKPPDIYVMTRVMFGVTSSPFLAIQAIRHHAFKQGLSDRCERLNEAVLKNMYVDDIHFGGDVVDDVLQQQRELVKFFKSGGWSLVKFASNSNDLMEQIPEQDRLPNCVLNLDDEKHGEASSLGLRWHTVHDVLYCNVPPRLREQSRIVTKRTILGKFSQIFDVFGFFSAFTIRAKILLQELWKRKLAWDDPVDELTESTFRKWADELSWLENIKIPRYIFSEIGRADTIQLHGFADASQSAYGAVVFVRATNSDGNVQINYLMSKTRVAPLKSMSIARLELMSAHLLAKLISYITDAWSSTFTVNNIYLWLDSEIALAWIAKPSSHWKTFVRNRVQEIHDSVSPDAWRHCPGKDNPADFHSRGMSLRQLKSSHLYWNGPPWLVSDESDWPNKVSLEDFTCEAIAVESTKRERAVLIVKEKPIVPFFEQKFNSYSTIVRVTARILRWRMLGSVKFDPTCNVRLIGPEEFKHAENFLWRLLQQTEFSRDFDALARGGRVSRKCSFIGMDPQFDNDRDLIVAGNRLQLSDLPESTKHPVILPAKSPLVEKFILHVHAQNHHAPQDTTIAIIRDSYTIIHIRGEVRKALSKCVVCRHHRTKPLSQKMGILPTERICEGPAFSEVGLDFTGPIYIDVGGGEAMQKAYICLFSCTRSRMVHLELTNDMSTEEFLAALRRMMNRRGWCRTVISDNQLTFKKAEKIIGLAVHASFKGRHDNEAFQKFLTDNNIVWKYITERAPHRGGFYERMNRSLKEPLRKILGKARLSYSELYTILTDIECLLNQRPLTYLGSDPTNPQAISPAHLAIGRSLRQAPDIPSSGNVTKRYRFLQSLMKQFWSRWSKEYLPSLLRRSRWTAIQKTPCVGDVCLIADEGRKRPQWIMGRIVQAIHSRDGLIRTYKLKTPKGVLCRPIQKLHLLEEMY